MVRVEINGKNVVGFQRIGYRGGIKQFCVMFQDGTEEDMGMYDIIEGAKVLKLSHDEFNLNDMLERM